MIREAINILEILNDEYIFPKIRKNIEEYTIRVPEQIIEFKLKGELDKNFYKEISYTWNIDESIIS